MQSLTPHTLLKCLQIQAYTHYDDSQKSFGTFHALLRILGTLGAVGDTVDLGLGHVRNVQKACESEQKVVFLRRRSRIRIL